MHATKQGESGKVTVARNDVQVLYIVTAEPVDAPVMQAKHAEPDAEQQR
jgi:hypothetical protein